jgi:hypothetical protein
MRAVVLAVMTLLSCSGHLPDVVLVAPATPPVHWLGMESGCGAAPTPVGVLTPRPAESFIRDLPTPIAVPPCAPPADCSFVRSL